VGSADDVLPREAEFTLDQWAAGLSRAKLCSFAMMGYIRKPVPGFQSCAPLLVVDGCGQEWPLHALEALVRQTDEKLMKSSIRHGGLQPGRDREHGRGKPTAQVQRRRHDARYSTHLAPKRVEAAVYGTAPHPKATNTYTLPRFPWPARCKSQIFNWALVWQYCGMRGYALRLGLKVSSAMCPSQLVT
jgi:hypothetical protein